jgi:hypothetical protein
MQKHQPIWRQCFGAATSLAIVPEQIPSLVSRLVQGLKALGIQLEPRTPISAPPTSDIKGIPEIPYVGFYEAFRELIAAHRVPGTGSILHIVFGRIADIHEITPVIPVGQAFDFWQRGPRSVLASFAKIQVAGRAFFDDIEQRWPVIERPKSAGLGHTKYVPLAQNSHNLPGVLFVVTTRDLGKDLKHYGRYINTPVEGIDYVIDRVIDAVNDHQLSSIAMPLLGTGYANIRRTLDHVGLARALRRAVALLTIEKLENTLRDDACSLRRGVIVIYSQKPHGQEEHDIWEHITRFLGSRTKQRTMQIDGSLEEIRKLIATTPRMDPSE